MSPALTRGATRAIKPLAWHPGFAIRFDALIFSRCPGSSGNPYTQTSSVRCAVDVSIIVVFPGTRAAASFAAASGRQRKTRSAEAKTSAFAAASFLKFSGILRSTGYSNISITIPRIIVITMPTIIFSFLLLFITLPPLFKFMNSYYLYKKLY